MQLFSKLSIFLLLLFSISLSFAQCPSEMSEKEHHDYFNHLKKLKKSNTAKSDQALMYVPLTIHILQDNNGADGTEILDIFEGIRKLNKEFSKANIQFYICGTPNYIRSTTMLTYNSTIPESILPSSQNIDKTINVVYHKSIYIDGFGGAGGFAHFPGGPLRITMSRGCNHLYFNS